MPRFPYLPILLLLLVASCTIEQENRFNDFEAPLLLTWVALQQRDEAAALQYNGELQQQWALLDSEYGHLANQREWRRHFQSIDLWLDKLDAAIDAKAWRQATVRVLQIQDELRSLRIRYGMESPADRLYDVHRRWESVTQISYDPMLCLYEWNEYEQIVAQAGQAWRDWLASGPAYYPELFPGTRHQQEALVRERADSLTLMIAEFESLLREGDQALTQAPSSEIQQLFYRYLTALTGFPTREKVLG